ncbi:peptidoglycan-binding protein [Salipaludibacillus sp. HK11]|uniref:peptidoglycan-binding protein n=1 Tax=Salipaludibacillus sp. HK11 TaxID=3394320 RepID=UPI0039FBDAE1
MQKIKYIILVMLALLLIPQSILAEELNEKGQIETNEEEEKQVNQEEPENINQVNSETNDSDDIIENQENLEENEPTSSQDGDELEVEIEDSTSESEDANDLEIQSVDEPEADPEEEAPQVNSDFEFGDRHERIVELKEGLNQIGFGTILVTEYFGNFTATQVRSFQEYYGLPVTGVADEETFDMLDSVLNHPYQEGKSHADLVDFKVKLNWMGYGHILVTENFGSWMDSRVKAFQQDHNLAVSGVIEPITEAALNETFASIFKQNNRHESIIELKNMLNQTSFGGILVSNLYGSYTATRVSQFQEYYGLEATGEANLATLKKLEEVLDTPFQEGRRHPDTIELKEGLNRLGFGTILVSDLYGSFTKQQVAAFQDTYGLRPTGIAHELTWAKLNELLNSPLQEGQSHNDLIDLKHKLNWTGYGHILVTENYGSWMASRVESFQKDHGLPVSGIIDDKTRTAIERTFEQGFKEGNRNPGVRQMKEGLNKLGFGNILVSDLYGSFTAKQVTSFQDYYGLQSTGQANLATLKQIDELVDSPFQEGNRHSDIPAIKEQMNQIGFGYITVTTLFGSYMDQKVRDVQDYYGLRVNGILDDPTQTKINDVFNSPHRQGIRDEETIALKERLNRIGFGNILVSDLYGSFTEKKVIDFQKHYGLVENGIADEPTWEKINEIYNSPYQLGKTHSNIPGFKRTLNAIGYGSISVTNYFGSFTESKVIEFQKDHNIPASGIIEKETRQLLDRYERYQIPRNSPLIVNGRSTYSYNQMLTDIDKLLKQYSGLTEKKVIGKSVDGRDIVAVKVGKGSREVFFNGSHHAREHMTTNLMMKMMDEYAHHYSAHTNMGNYNVRWVLNDVSIWFVPMVNPDGVMLVQEGASSANNPSAAIALNNGSTNFRHWKANVRGVDLNRQYPARWDTIVNTASSPGSELYKGPNPLSEPETKAVYDFINDHNFRAVLSYHSSGEVLFTRYNVSYPYSQSIANGVSSLTGYNVINLQASPGGGGLTDWVILNKRIPALTPEISPYVGNRPVPLSNWNNIWNQNRLVGLYTANMARY